MKASPAEGRRRLHTNTACVPPFRVSTGLHVLQHAWLTQKLWCGEATGHWEPLWVIHTSCEPISMVPLLPRGFCCNGSPPSRICKGLGCCCSSARDPEPTICSDLVSDFAAEHDLALRECLSEILGCEVPDTSWEVANLPFSIGGLGLRSAPRLSTAIGQLGRLSPHSAIEAPGR